MTQQHIQPHQPSETRRSLPLVSSNKAIKNRDADTVAEELEKFEAAERERLGIKAKRKQWVDTMLTPNVTREERDNVTLLISGLTKAQDFMVEGALRGQGYNVRDIGCPDQDGFQAGKEFGNRGQCNPTYFTVGNLVKYLIDRRDLHGESTEDIIKNYVFFTAGACGPCRFGMYVTEYRKALRDAGFEGFRIILFQQQGGLSQASGEDPGIDMSPPFFLAMVKAIVAGDAMNALGYRIRPYEINPGETNRVMEECKRICYEALYEKRSILRALYQCRAKFEAIPIDKLRAAAKTSIIGEFWAMTTEGDGNYQLQTFLESEGMENDIQLTTAWLLYNIWEVSRDTRERGDLRVDDSGKDGLSEFDGGFDITKRLATLRLAEIALRATFASFATPLGLFKYPLPDMDLIAEVAQEHYHNDLRGGEGHMEVGKLIVNIIKSKAHMTLSVKPFGCMPSSSVSDGVQSLITTKFPGTIYCAVETSGDGATNFYSRVQMYTYKARLAAKAELELAYETHGVTEVEVRAFLKDNPKYASPLHHAPHAYAGSAANLVAEVAPLMLLSRRERLTQKAQARIEKLSAHAKAAPGKLKDFAVMLQTPEFREAAKQDVMLIKDLAQGKVKERFGPLVAKLAGKAYTENNADAVVLSTEPMAAE